MTATASSSTRLPPASAVRWRPQAGPQAALVSCPIPEILYGGARGGGKTDGVLGRIGLRAGHYGRHYNAVVFRREMPQADDMLERARELYQDIADFRENDSSFRFGNGARLRFRPLQRVSDAEKYQGQNLSECYIEEAGNFPDSAPILRLWGALRSAHGIPTAMVMTANPGGPGQHWLAERFDILRYPDGYRVVRQRLPGGGLAERVFIPARVRDNRILLDNDPNYIRNLYLVGSRELVRAWLDGDWAAVAGAFFDCWEPARHIIRPAVLPADWLRFRSMDWGSARPASIGWWAVVGDDWRHPADQGVVLPRGALLRYRELYVAEGANVGRKWTAEQVAQEVRRLTPDDERIAYTVADPAMFAQDGGPSLAERFGACGVHLRPADNKRVAQRGALGGWDLMRQRMLGDDDGRPMIACFSTCRDSIRTIPALQHDDARPEDIDTDGEDHAADEWRYACASRPWVRATAPVRDPLQEMTRPRTMREMLGDIEPAEAGRGRKI
jgi:hypothetical protein